MGGAGITTFLALVGRTRPGTFLKSTAYLSAATTSYAVLDAYGRREVNRAIFRWDNVEPKPGKLWERTKGWTVDDVVLGGGMLATVLVLNPKAVPGVGGWKRFLGAVTVGCAAGCYVGERVIMPMPGVISTLHDASVQVRDAQYARLREDIKAQDALSRFGKLALSYYTSSLRNLSINPFRSGPQANAAGGAVSHVGLVQGHTDKPTVIGMEFKKRELDGPDMEDGYRVYRDSLLERDKDGLQSWLERLQEMQKERHLESRYLRLYLDLKEQEFYKMQIEDREKDLLRRQLQLLNAMASDSYLRIAAFEYNIADAYKRLEQTDPDVTPHNQKSTLGKISAPETFTPDQMANFRPHAITDRLRVIWSNKKRVVGVLEETAELHKLVPYEHGSPQQARLDKMQQDVEVLKLNIEATERLLVEFEDLVRTADEGSRNSKPLGAS